MRFPVIERLMVRGSQVALKHVIHDMVTRSLVMELRRCAIKRWVPCGDKDRRLKIPNSAKVECGFRILPRNAYMIAVSLAFSIGPHNTIQYNTILSCVLALSQICQISLNETGIYFFSVQSLIVFSIIICLLFTLMRGSRRTRHDNLGSKKKKNYCKLLDKNTHNIVDFSDNHSEIISLPMTATV